MIGSEIIISANTVLEDDGALGEFDIELNAKDSSGRRSAGGGGDGDKGGEV